MRRLGFLLISLATSALLSAAPAQAQFGLKDVELSIGGSTKAGTHPFSVTTRLDVNTVVDSASGKDVPDGAVEDLMVELPPGLVGTPTPGPRCSSAEFLEVVNGYASCQDEAAIGIVVSRASFRPGSGTLYSPVYNLVPSPGVAAKIGFVALEVPVTVELSVNPEPPHNVIARATNLPQVTLFYGADMTVWGVPADPAHDSLRGRCIDVLGGTPTEPASLGDCEVDLPEKPFITLPRACTGPLTTIFSAVAWNTGATDVAEPVNRPAMTDCDELGFGPLISGTPMTERADAPMGIEVGVDVDDEGLTDPKKAAESDVKKATVTLPEGVSVNPAVANGLASCTPAQYRLERADSEPGDGCPEAAKIGTVEIETPLLEGEVLNGALFAAQQDDPATPTPGAENPFDSMLAVYLVVKSPQLGVVVKAAGEVQADSRSGQLVTTFDDLPQLPFSHVRVRLRGGDRSPLVSPAACGEHAIEAEFTPWAAPGDTFQSTSTFQISQGTGGGPCAGTPRPFAPGFTAGSLDDTAGSHTPFYMRFTRGDGEQEITRVSAVLPPGLLAKLAGVERCSDAAIAAARTKTGRQELASPSCPPTSRIGRVLAGAGVGSQLTYVEGKAYLAGPFAGAPLSAVVVTPAVSGPFDLGTVVVREALDVDPKTAEVQVKGAVSDPIPRILRGIPVKLRELEVYIDRDRFALNPTNCKPKQVRSQLLGGGVDPFSAADDLAVDLTSPFQVSRCGRLKFGPKLSLRLRGGTRRGDHPALQAVLRARKGDANMAGAVVRLPRSVFLDQAHIRTICTRVQFAAGQCPKGAVYGRVTAFTPLLDEPLAGPVYLRSSDNPLPDLVFDLHGVVDVEVSARIDSIKGGIRATFGAVPDAPISKVVLKMRGGNRGLAVNSRNLCFGEHRASVRLRAQNGRRQSTSPLVRVRCRDN